MPPILQTVLIVLLAMPAAVRPASLESTASFAERADDPVVLSGSAVAAHFAISPSRLVAYRFDATGWHRIAVQVDERDERDFGTLFSPPQSNGVVGRFYTDPQTLVGADTNPSIDADDEIVFMAGDAGGLSDGSLPPGVTSAGARVRLTDPLAACEPGYVYLFESASEPAPLPRPVTYNLVFLSGRSCLDEYAEAQGPHPEDSTVVAPAYKLHFSDRWLLDRLVLSPNGPNLVERRKLGFGPGNCNRTERTFCGYDLPGNGTSHGAFIANRTGPVRAIRSYLGANSGILTQSDHTFYARRHDVTTTLRVHPIATFAIYYDYSSSALGMQYYRKLTTTPAGSVTPVTVDGVPDALASGTLEWEMLTGPTKGTQVIAHRVESDVPSVAVTSYYDDQANAPLAQCTANDKHAYGQSGLRVAPVSPATKIACTDPLRLGLETCPTLYNLRFVESAYYYAPGMSVSVAQADRLNQRAASPVRAVAAPLVDGVPQVFSSTVGAFAGAGTTWFLRASNSPGPAGATFSFGPSGTAGSPVVGDWDGDGVDTVGFYASATSTFFLKNTNGPGPADLAFKFGAPSPSRVPLVGDWDGDGADSIGLYDTATGTFFLKNCNSPGAADLTFGYGPVSIDVVPLAGDWDGDRSDTIGVYVRSTGTFFLKNDNGSGTADLSFRYGSGGPSVTPIMGDWDSDGDDTPGLYAAATKGFFLKNDNAPGGADLVFTYGPANARPLAGNWGLGKP